MNIYKPRENNYAKLFTEIKREFLKLDPVAFVENYLKVDGAEPYKISGNGWKFMADIFRYIAIKATQPDGKPVVILKGRQVGATTMAGALDLYFTASGLFGRSNPSMRVLHCFPKLDLVKRFAQDKLETMIRTSEGDYINKQKLGYNPKTKKVSDPKIPDNITLKQFVGGCNLWTESLGDDGDRIRGMTADGIFFDECFPYNQCIEIEDGQKKEIGRLYNDFIAGKRVPLVKTFNEARQNFEYKKILNAWKRGPRQLVKITCGNRKIRCTENHRFLTDNGWRRADELKMGTLVKCAPYANLGIRALNDDQMQVVLGSFMGDGHLAKYKYNRYRLRMTHGMAQSEYCHWKMSLFDGKIRNVKCSGFSKKPAIAGATKTFALSKELPQTKTACPQWVIDALDARGIAIWVMDDGAVQKWGTGANVTLHTCSFDEDTQKRLVEKFKQLGIECYYKHSKGNFYSIYFNKSGALQLFKLIAPYMHNNIMYKMPDEFIGLNLYSWDSDFKDFNYTVVDGITLDYEAEVYDIEVEDNHNFIITPGRTSKNCGGLIAHNCQDMSKQAIGNATKLLTAAKYGPVGIGVQLYFGTPKNKGSYFEKTLWDQSDKRYYHLGCINPECKQFFLLYTPGSDEWENIWLAGFIVKCPYCNFEQDKRSAIDNGKWIATEPTDHDGREKPYVGFHINQLYIPYFAKENILKLQPKNNPSQSERIYFNEVLGEFYSGAGMPITKEEIYEKCRDPERLFARSINSSQRKTWMGIDWGGKTDTENVSGGQSYSCAVVISSEFDGSINIEFAYKLTSTDFQYQMAFVQEMYRKYGIRIAVADFFYGQDVVGELQKIYGAKFLGCHAQGTMKADTSYDKDMLLLKWNKDFYIEELYNLMRKGKVRFPWKSYESMAFLIDHITSMEIENKFVNGVPRKSFRKGATPNDGFMSLIHAYLAMKFEMTNGYSMNINNPKNTQAVMPVLAYVPKIR